MTLYGISAVNGVFRDTTGYFAIAFTSFCIDLWTVGSRAQPVTCRRPQNRLEAVIVRPAKPFAFSGRRPHRSHCLGNGDAVTRGRLDGRNSNRAVSRRPLVIYRKR